MRVGALLVIFVCALLVSVHAGPYFVRVLNINGDLASAATISVGATSYGSVAYRSVSGYERIDAPGGQLVVDGVGMYNVSVSDAAEDVQFKTVLYYALTANASQLMVDDDYRSPGNEYHGIRGVLSAYTGSSMSISSNGKTIVAGILSADTTNGIVGDQTGDAMSNTTELDFHVPSGDAAVEASATGLTLAGGAATMFLLIPGPVVVEVPGEHVYGTGVILTEDLTGETLFSALTTAGATVITVTDSTLVANDLTLTETSSLVVTAPLTVSGALQLLDDTRIRVSAVTLAGSLSLDASATFELWVSGGEEEEEEGEEAPDAPILVIAGRAELQGAAVVLVLAPSADFRSGTEVTLVTCSPCVGTLGNITVTTMGGRRRQRRLHQAVLNAQRPTATVSCTTTSCVATADAPVLGESSSSREDKIIIASLLFSVAFICFVAFFAFKWHEMRKAKRALPMKDYEVQRVLRKYEDNRAKVSKKRKKQEASLGVAQDASLVLAEFDVDGGSSSSSPSSSASYSYSYSYDS